MNFDTTKYKVWTWKHPLMLHWILNPGLAINELFLGQRVPKVSLIEKNNNKSLAEKSFIPCPHCNTIHPGLKWTTQNKTAFGNWFGLYCDNCGGIIPCLRNLTSAVLLIVTFPFWIWFVKSWKTKWLETQKQKFSSPLKLTIPEYNWVTQGLSFGFFMFVFMDLIFPLFDGEGYSPLKLLVGVVVCTLAGLLFGYVMKKLIFNQPRKNSQDETQQAT
ncbi:MAG: hypothetical protein ACTHMD_14560 [Flavisolibacter sp.]